MTALAALLRRLADKLDPPRHKAGDCMLVWKSSWHRDGGRGNRWYTHGTPTSEHPSVYLRRHMEAHRTGKKLPI